MSPRMEGSFSRKGVVVLALALTIALLVPAAQAQSGEPPVPKVEIFAGYAWMEPGAKILGVPLESMPTGGGLSVTVNVDKNWGLEMDFGGNHGPNAAVGTFMAGPRYKFRNERISPFVHFLVGAHLLAPEGMDTTTGFGLAAGGGIDIHASRLIDIRLIQADYIFAHHNLEPIPGVPVDPGRINMNGARLRAGIVFNLGGEPPIPPSCSVSASPMEVMAGEPVNATANGANFKQGRTLNATWSSMGAKVTGSGMSATVDTTGMAPGSYSVSATVSDGKKATANCSAHFMVKEPPRNPPRLSCSANPATVKSGESSTISCTCSSPDGRPVSYSGWSASAGTLSPSDANATLDTAGLPSGPVTVNTTCSDDRGLSDSATTSVNVEAPPPPPQVSKLGECDFKTARVDNKCKAVLDDVALRMQRDADARVVIVGYAGPKEAKGVAGQRATNSKTYLVKEKGIDPSRIDVMTGTGGDKRAEYYIVPAGATWSMPGTEMVMEKPMKKKSGK